MFLCMSLPVGLQPPLLRTMIDSFQIDFDLIDHMLIIETTDDSIRKIALRSCSVAEFYQDTMDALESLKMPVTIWTIPVEVPDRTQS